MYMYMYTYMERTSNSMGRGKMPVRRSPCCVGLTDPWEDQQSLWKMTGKFWKIRREAIPNPINYGYQGLLILTNPNIYCRDSKPFFSVFMFGGSWQFGDDFQPLVTFGHSKCQVDGMSKAFTRCQWCQCLLAAVVHIDAEQMGTYTHYSYGFRSWSLAIWVQIK